MRGVLLVVLLVACVPDQPSGPGVKGSRADLHTAAGTYAGYAVQYPCMGTWTDVGVRGLGTQAVTAVSDIEAVGADIVAALRDVPSVWGGAGYGLVCEPGVGTNVYLSDWRDVDRVIERVGQILHDRDLALQVGIKVDGIPVPDSN